MPTSPFERQLAFGLLVVFGCGPVPESAGPDRDPRVVEPTEEMIAAAAAAIEEVVDGFVGWYFQTHPVRATRLGVHDYDAELPDLTRPVIQTRIDELLDWLTELEEVRFDHLRGDARLEYAVLEHGLREELMELEEIRRWARDPRVYTAVIEDGLAGILDRRHTPLADRVESLTGRLAAAPAVLAAARDNLTAPPRMWTELAIEEADRLLAFLETGLEGALTDETATRPALPASLATARDGLVAALVDHRDWLEADLLPRSTGDFRLGRYLLERKLLYAEHVALRADDLERLNRTVIRDYTQRVQAVAAEIDSTRTPRAIIDSLMAIHPGPSGLVDAARSRMIELRDWLEGADVVALPTHGVPTVRETPSYRSTRFAGLDAPGPFSEDSLEAFYTLNSGSPGWSAAEIEQHLTYFNDAELVSVTAHSTYPGRHVQASYARRAESAIRRIFLPRTLTDGWSHYAEQVVLDEGFRAADPAVRLMQLRRALQRQARWYAVLALHARGASIDEAVAGFIEIADAAVLPARRQVLRATWDPLYLSDALGRMQIIELRKDHEARLAEAGDGEFELAAFHERLLGLSLPLTLARDVLIPLQERGRGRAGRR